MPTKDELEAENAQLRERVAELESDPGAAAGGAAGTPPAPRHPSFGLSAGEVADLQAAGVTTSPFTGKVLNALDLGIEPATTEARRNAERERRERTNPTPLPEPVDVEAPEVPAGVREHANALVGDETAPAGE